jgi:site-specific recombinase XerD
MKISEAFELYVLCFVTPYQSSGTAGVFKRAQKSFKKFQDIELTELDQSYVLGWQKSLSHLSPNTVRGYTEKLRKVLKYHRASGVDCMDYTLVHSPKKQETVPEWLSAKEVNKLIQESFRRRHGRSKITRYRTTAIVAILYSTGLRVHELCNLNKKDIKGLSISVIGKGQKPRIVFLDKRSVYYLNEYLNLRKDNNQALFVNLQGDRLITDCVRDSFAKLSKYIGKEVHPHTLRHSYATNLLENGCHIYTLQRLMGHSSIQSTQQYLHLVDKDLEEAFDKYHKC